MERKAQPSTSGMKLILKVLVSCFLLTIEGVYNTKHHNLDISVKFLDSYESGHQNFTSQ